MRILPAVSLRFPGEGSSAQGKSGPKLRLKSVDDGQSVEIPIPPYTVMSDGGTQEGRSSAPLVVCAQAGRRKRRQIRASYTLSCDAEGTIVPK